MPGEELGHHEGWVRDARRKLQETTFDLLVIGGGIHGAALARDAALRGWRVALVEAHDWGWGTSAKSSRLAHGGLRYLEQFEIGLVREALRDREILLKTAPHHVVPLRFQYPIYDQTVKKRTVRLGLLAYDLLSPRKSLPRRGRMSVQQVSAKTPGLVREGLHGAATFWDAQIQHVERLVAAWVEDAVQHGCVALNRARVTEFLRGSDGAVEGAYVASDGQRLRVRARKTVNATGVWADGLARLVRPEAPAKIRTTKGIHLLLPRLSDDGLLIRATDGRAFFVLPYRDKSLVGTTDTDDTEAPETVQADERDVAYLMESVRQYFPDVNDPERIAFAGLRALVRQEGIPESRVTRRSLLYDHAKREGIPGLWTLQGGKITTSRRFAERILNHLGGRKSHPTRAANLQGTPDMSWTAFVEEETQRRTREGLAPDLARALVRRWGTRTEEVLACGEAERVGRTDYAWCELRFLIATTQVRGTADLLLRRTDLALATGFDAHLAGEVHAWLTGLAGWSQGRAQAEWAAFEQEAGTWTIRYRQQKS